MESLENTKELLENLNEVNLKKDETSQTRKLVELNPKIAKYIQFLRIMSTLKLFKEDNQPVEIVDNIFIGSIGAASNKDALIENKITHIISAGTGLKKYFPEDYTYLSINLLDSPDEEIKKYFNQTGEFINDCLSSNGKVLVHCHAGISRSSTIIISYLMKYYKLNLEEALNLSRAKRAKINPNTGFIKQLKEYENEVLEKLQ